MNPSPARRDPDAPAIEASGLTKRFGALRALDDLDLVAPAGRVTALLGPNGSGKTTFVRAVATLAPPDSGQLHVAGIDAMAHPAQVRRRIGLAGQSAAVDDTLTGRENLQMIARLFGHRRRPARRVADQVLDLLRLTDVGKRLVRTYSGGMRRRLDLGVSLVGGPRLLLLDEPTTGLDPRSRNELWGVIRDLVVAGTDVLLTTQYLDEADQLAHHVVIIDRGRAIATGTPDELKRSAGRDVIEVRTRRADDLPAVADALAPLTAEQPVMDRAARRVTIPSDHGAARLAQAVRITDALPIELDDIGLRRPTLDEVFLVLTGHVPTDDQTDPTAATGAPTPA